jgi:GH35 family endo-1,4-beta-xylanase
MIMKYFNKTWLSAVALVALASCADDGRLDFIVEKPETIKELEYLKDYDVLKSYIDRTANPNFKLGAGVSVADFNKQEVDYSLLASNFDEMTAGWEMKHGGVVQNDGSLSLGNVKSFVDLASKAGMTVFGHTLCWHSNQNAKYLNSTIAPVVIPGSSGPTWDVVTEANFETDDASNYESNANAILSFTASGGGKGGVGRAIKITNEAVRANDWESQFFVKFAPKMVAGERYILTMDVRADAAANVGTQAHTAPGSYKHWDFFGTIGATTEWATYTKEITISADVATTGAIAFNLGATATSYYFDNISLKKFNEEGGGGPTWDLVSGANFETDNNSNYLGNTNALMSFTADGQGANGVGRALKITNEAVRANEWDCQFFVTFSPAMVAGEKYELSMDVRTDADASFATQAHTVPYSYKHWDFFGSISATTAWSKFTKVITVSADVATTGTIAFNLGKNATSYYFDNITLKKYNEFGGGPKTIEKTPEEKKTIITAELERWIAGMLDATKDKVKAWDVVNEPMSDWPDPSQLKTGVGKSNLPADEFYWQDYLGKDYAVKAIELARKYGNSNDILFINDYGLEGEDQKKCKGLIDYIAYVESQGVKVDGIGTQMHVTCGQTKIEGIRAMLTNLAATGKLIKISELDMGYRVEGASENVKTEDMTNEQHEEMAAFYKQIVAAYFELVPAAQRYGITVWSPLDSPAESSWRGGEPIGLWNSGYNRKHAYGSIADALSGK